MRSSSVLVYETDQSGASTTKTICILFSWTIYNIVRQEKEELPWRFYSISVWSVCRQKLSFPFITTSTIHSDYPGDSDLVSVAVVRQCGLYGALVIEKLWCRCCWRKNACNLRIQLNLPVAKVNWFYWRSISDMKITTFFVLSFSWMNLFFNEQLPIYFLYSIN